MLGAAHVAGYLLDRGLLDPRAVVRGRLTIADHSGANGVFVVTAEGFPGVVVKTGPGVAREAAILARLHAAAGGGALARALPAVLAYDAAAEVLVLAAAPGARDLARHHGRGRFSRALAGEVGGALAALHALPPTALDGIAAVAAAPPPHRPDLATLRALSAAAIELTRILQRSRELCDELDALLAEPPRGACVTHGDVRWGNCVALRSAARGWTRVQLVDWELCARGDPAADAGAFIGEYLRAWQRSIPVADPRDPGPLRAGARVPLGRLRPAVQAFWAAYSRRPVAVAARPAPLRRSMRFAGLRLLVAALEEAQALDAPRPGVLGLLPLGRNVLARPDDAAELLGLA